VRRAAVAAGFFLLLAIDASAAGRSWDPWGDVTAPTKGPPQAIGEAARGCLAGARPLPLDGVGYQVIRISRNRYWSHPQTVDFLTKLGKAAASSGLAPFYVGDMSLPRGGPMPNGHASHQSGVDADIWFNLDPKPKLAPPMREDPPLPSMVSERNQNVIDPKRFGPAQVTLLRLAASDQRVDRIFVNKAIKRALCEMPGDHAWLHKLRPWYGHDEHFHVRLACPPGSANCVRQDPVPPGDGCDATLDSWFLQPAPPPVPKGPPRPRPLPRLPAECRAVLAGR
jgi:penicillin-insensitive murein endopeptidase